MKKSYCVLVMLLFLFQINYLKTDAQTVGITTQNTKIVVASNTTVTVPGDVVITSATDEIINNGTINLSGNFTNNGSGFNTAGTGTLFFNGTLQQTVSGTGTMTFNSVTVDNTATTLARGVLLNSDINVGGALTLTTGPLILTGRTVTLNGSVSHTNGSLTGSATSNLVLNNSAAKALYFTSLGNVLHDLTINAGATSVSLDNALDITSGMAYGTVICNGALQTNGRLTLKSDINGTAAIGTSYGTITGNATVERYTDGSFVGGGSSRRAWRLMTSPVINGQTIRQAWQEDGLITTGNGTLITGYQMPDAGTAALQGYDFTKAGADASIKRYSITSGSWQPLFSDGYPDNTMIPVRNEQAYLLFVRGDRTVGATGSSTTTLRALGSLLQGNQPIPLSPGSYTLIGNPYACTIDFASLYNNNSALIQNAFYFWNSKLNPYGGYVLVSYASNSYVATPSPLTGSNGDDYKYIPSGSGFFVSPNSGVTTGNVIIQESDKAAGKVPPVSPFRVVANAANERQLRVNLNTRDTDTSALLTDGFRALFSADYEGNETDNSHLKQTNLYENLGLTRSGADLIIEARGEVKKTDTLYMKLWKTGIKKYQFQTKADNFISAPGIRAWLDDSYLQAKSELALDGGITTVNFEVNTDSGSWKSDRFRIVFENSNALPVTLTKITALPKNGGVEVGWTVANETNIKGYTVEKSTDGGRTFIPMGAQQAAHNNPQAAITSYSGYDAAPKAGDNYYRIRIEAKDGTVTYSTVAKATIGGNGNSILITLYPNPVREGKASLQLTNLKEGAYLVSVYSGSGQTVFRKKIYVTSANATQTEPLLLGNTLAQGSYQIKVADNKGNVIFNDQLIISK